MRAVGVIAVLLVVSALLTAVIAPLAMIAIPAARADARLGAGLIVTTGAALFGLLVLAWRRWAK